MDISRISGNIKSASIFATIFFIAGGIASILWSVNLYYEIRINRQELKKNKQNET